MDLSGTVKIQGKKYVISRLLGHGKGGYSYFADSEDGPVVTKRIHHEPIDYYSFGNKIEAELNDYARLTKAGIRIPKMLRFDREKEIIVKEYVDGPTVFDIVRDTGSAEEYFGQIREMAAGAKEAGLNIDYFPTNFVVNDGSLWYIDYECNDYMEEWNFENWGIQYWSRTRRFEEYLRQNENN